MNGMGLDRRSLLAAGPLLLAAIAAGDKTGNLGEIKLAPPPEAGPDPSETFIQNYQNIVFESWGNLPPHSGEMAMLYGDFNTPGPYLVMMNGIRDGSAHHIPMRPTGFRWWLTAHGSSTAGRISNRRMQYLSGRVAM
jgi:hypothetical protein